VADAVIVLQNDCLIELVDVNAGMEEAFRKSDDQVAATIHSLWYMLNFRGVLNLDFADLRHLVERSGGICHFGYGEVVGASRMASAVRALMDSPYLAKGRALSEAVALLINITGGPDLTLADTQNIMAQIKAVAKPTAQLFFGAMIDPAMRNRLALTAIAADYQSSKKSVVIKETAEAAGTKKSGGRTKSGPSQAEIVFPPTDKGRFTNTSPTNFRGEDIDIPTYIRRGIKLSFEK